MPHDDSLFTVRTLHRLPLWFAPKFGAFAKGKTRSLDLPAYFVGRRLAIVFSDSPSNDSGMLMKHGLEHSLVFGAPMGITVIIINQPCRF
jgi:hypothetical protein